MQYRSWFGDIEHIYNVSGNNIQMVGFVIIYIHHKGYTRLLMVPVAKKIGRDGEIIVSLRTLRRMGTILEVWP